MRKIVCLLIAVCVVISIIPMASAYATIYNGTQGSDVGTLQTMLNELQNTGLNVDGICGPKTMEAVKKFQAQNGLTADGICGPATWSKLTKAYEQMKETQAEPILPEGDVSVNVSGLSSYYMEGSFYQELIKCKMTGNQRSDIVKVAASQIGYHEGNSAQMISGEYLGSKNFTEYGTTMFGISGSWCAMFISWCARRANIPITIVGNSTFATAKTFGCEYVGRNRERTEEITYTPLPGDIIIYDWTSDGYNVSPADASGDHVGIVEYVKDGYVHTIEGNKGSSHAVERRTVALSSTEIKGYAVPKYTGTDISEPVACTDHVWDDGKITREPTYESTGEMKFTCTNCGETMTETLAKKECTNHIWNNGEITREPTYETTGIMQYTCTRCGETKTETLAKKECTNHVWDDGKITREPSYETAGIIKYTCTRCGETRTDTLPQLEKQQNGTLDHFREENAYLDQFDDVHATDWFYKNIMTAYNLGLMKGASLSVFNVSGNLSVAEAVTMACRLHSIFYTGQENFVQSGTVWYKVYLDYAAANGIMEQEEYSNYTRNVTRAEFAKILAAALPAEALEEINSVSVGQIPDVYGGEDYADAVYLLYRAGVLTGSDAAGTFRPDTGISRAEACAIITRMAVPSLRVKR